MEKGYVYILTNPAFKENWVKIGKSSRPVDVRSKELDNTSTPLPFEIYATIETEKYSEVEVMMHQSIERFTDLRIRKNREFFNVSPENALEIMKSIAKILDGEVITIYKNNEPYIKITDEGSFMVDQEEIPEYEEEDTKPKERRTRFKFSMIGLSVGDVIEFLPTKELVEIASDNTVRREDGSIWTTSKFCKEFMPKKNNSGAYQGPLFFGIDGKSLAQIRIEQEKNN